jgi:hypothetical protein
MAGWLTRKLTKGTNEAVSQLMNKALWAVTPPDPATTEATFRDAVMSGLAEIFGTDIELKREAGIQGSGTRIDIYAHLCNHDYLITIKKGLSEQKVKKVIGEINIFLDRWRPRVSGSKTFVIFYIFGVKSEKEHEALIPFMEFAARANTTHAKSFEISFAAAEGVEEE